MRIAIPIVDDWTAPVFDKATRLLVVDIEPGRQVEQSELPSFVRPSDQRAAELAALGIDVLLCDGISTTLARCIRERGIEIKESVSQAVDEILTALIEESRTAQLRPALAT